MFDLNIFCFQALWSEVFALSNSLAGLREKLSSCETNIAMFRDRANMRGDRIREGLVGYLAHSLKVEEAIALRKFKCQTLLSDVKRLHELYLHLKQSRQEAILRVQRLGAVRGAKEALGVL